MNDRPDELVIDITAEDIRDTDEVLARSNTSHCFRCLTPKPEDYERQHWATVLLESITRGKYFVFACPNCVQPVEEWASGYDDEILGDIEDIDIR